MRLIKGLICVMTLAVVSCQDVEKSVDSPRKVKCKEVVVAAENFETATFPGKVVAATDVNLGFRVAGIVDEICAVDGAFVCQGDVIARLDSRDYELQLAATQAEYDAVKAEVDRVVALYDDKSVSANDYDKAVNGLRAITAKLNAHKNALADTQLRAPFDGYVQKSNFDKGEAVAAGTPVISIISAKAPEITINIPARYYIRQKDFEQATATIAILGGTQFDLKLKGVSPKSNLNQLYQASFVVNSVDGVFPSAGMTAMVELKYKKECSSFTSIPFKAVVERDGKSFIWLFVDGEVVSRKVDVVEIKSDGRVILSGGVVAGDMVVTAGVNSLKDGDKVEILKEASNSNVGGVL